MPDKTVRFRGEWQHCPYDSTVLCPETRQPENRQILSDGWHQYFGFRIPPGEICCDGCLDENPQLIDSGCPVRPCVIEQRLDNCAQCEQFICEKLEQRLVEYTEIRSQLGVEIPDDDYQPFIRPYENKRRLEALRASKFYLSKSKL